MHCLICPSECDRVQIKCNGQGNMGVSLTSTIGFDDTALTQFWACSSITDWANTKWNVSYWIELVTIPPEESSVFQSKRTLLDFVTFVCCFSNRHPPLIGWCGWLPNPYNDLRHANISFSIHKHLWRQNMVRWPEHFFVSQVLVVLHTQTLILNSFVLVAVDVISNTWYEDESSWSSS